MKQVMPGFFFLFSSLSVVFFFLLLSFLFVCLFVFLVRFFVCWFFSLVCMFTLFVCLFYYVDLAMGGDGLISNQSEIGRGKVGGGAYTWE